MTKFNPMFKLCLVAIAILAVGLAYAIATRTDNTVTQWEHGFKTNRVIAIRYKNPTIGFNIGFLFPKDPNNSDREEISDCMKAHNGTVFQGGGYPGAEMFVGFSDVTDKYTADKKLQQILPGLNQLMADMAADKGIRIDPDRQFGFTYHLKTPRLTFHRLHLVRPPTISTKMILVTLRLKHTRCG